MCITLSFYELFTRPKMDMMQFFRMKHGSLNGWCRLLSSNYTNWLIVWRKYTNYCSMWESTMAWAAFIYLTDLCLFVCFVICHCLYIWFKTNQIGCVKIKWMRALYWWMAKENTQPQNMSSYMLIFFSCWVLTLAYYSCDPYLKNLSTIYEKLNSKRS